MLLIIKKCPTFGTGQKVGHIAKKEKKGTLLKIFE
jgi:hypothetical protein